jgi:pimeloyl-ACP methyl ester carboxylesterase
MDGVKTFEPGKARKPPQGGTMPGRAAWVSGRPPQQGRTMEHMRIFRAVAELENVHIFYRDTQGNGQPVLCLHGRWGRGETWVDFMQHYGDRYRVIAPDQRGHGLSGKPASSYTTEEMAGDMISLMNSLGVNSVILIGHSMGGAIAGYIAATHPGYAKALAILDKSAAGPKTRAADGEAADPITKNWPLPFTSLAEAQECIRRDMESELSCQYFMNSLVETVEGYRMMFNSQAMAANIAHYEDWFDLLPKIQCPVLLMRAKGGEAVPDEDFARMQSMIRNCTARETSDPDHNVYLSRKDEFYRYMDEFLQGIR